MASNYTGDPTQVRAPGSAPIALDAPIVVFPADGDAANVASIEQLVKHLTDFVAALRNVAVTSIFGDGSDGDASGSITATNTKFYNNWSTGVGGQVNGHPIYVRDTLTWSGGTIAANGANGSAGAGGTGGAGATQATGLVHHAGGAGRAGANSAAGQPAAAADIFCPGAFGAGGAGGAGADGAGGAAGSIIQDPYSWKIPPFRQGHNHSWASGLASLFRGGGGGGGGRGGGGGGGGGGGSGGGLIVIVARKIVITGSPAFASTGGIGGAGQPATNAGGGGGGGGGGVIVIYSELSGALPAVTVTGGAGGAGTGTGSAGSAGSAGLATVLALQVSA